MTDKGRIYAYCRISKNDGSMTIENQTHAITKWAKEHNLTISAFFKDECKGDTPVEKRKQLPLLLENLQEGDTVVVVEVFRLYRSFSGLQAVYKTIVEDKKSEFVTLNQKEQILCTSYGDNDDIMQKSMKSMVLIFMALFSELEKKNISTRTKRALAERRDAGVELGRPKAVKPKDFGRLYALAKAGKRTHSSVMKELGLKRTTYYKLAKQEEEENCN